MASTARNREQAIPTEVPEGRGSATCRARSPNTASITSACCEYIKTTKDDLRAHFVPRQGCDAYQWALLISTHEQRHILQIREVKADKRFPAK